TDPTFIGSGIPSAIRPATSRMVPCVVVNNNVTELGLVDIQSNGNFTLYRAITTSGAPVPSASAFSHSNSKGLPDDWMTFYPKGRGGPRRPRQFAPLAAATAG